MKTGELKHNKLEKLINKLTKCLHSEVERVILEEDDLKTMIEFGWNKGE